MWIMFDLFSWCHFYTSFTTCLLHFLQKICLPLQRQESPVVEFQDLYPLIPMIKVCIGLPAL